MSLQDRLCSARTRPQARRAPGAPPLATVGVGLLGGVVWVLSLAWLAGVI